MDASLLRAVADQLGVDTHQRTGLWRERMDQDEPLIHAVRSWQPQHGMARAALPWTARDGTASWALRPGESAASRVEAALEVIAANPGANAFTEVFTEEARAVAEALDQRARAGDRMGPLYGAVFSVKDIMDVRGRAVTGGTRALHALVAEHDAEAVRRLRAADAVLVGTTNLHALAFGPFSTSSDRGAVRNPLRHDAVAGGSSGGSAAAVAMGAADLSLGTDTAGSIRIPSALCGVVGLKGTYGRAPMSAVHPLAASLDHVGPIARTVEDTALAWSVLAGGDEPLAPVARGSLGGLVVGDLGEEARAGLDDAVRSALEDVLETVVRCGGVVRPVRLRDLARAPGAMLCTIGPEALDVHGELLRDRAAQLPEDVRLRLETAQFLQAVDYVRAQRLRERLTSRLSAAFDDVDVLLLPTLPIVAPGLDTLDRTVSGGVWTTRAAMSRFTLLGNLTGHPSVTIPWGRDDAGGGIGIQLMGPHGGDMAMLTTARLLEQQRRAIL